MRAYSIWSLVIPAALLIMASCSAGSSGNTGFNRAPGLESTLGSHLPSPAELDGGPRAATVADEQDYSLQLDQIMQADNAGMIGDELQLTSAADPAWAIYLIDGFDGDMLPLCARVSVASGEGEYLVGFSDYQNGRWNFSGPYTGTSDVDLPLGTDANHPSRFISEYGNMHLVVLMDDSSLLQIDEINLSVFGGSTGPLPPRNLRESDGGTSIIMSWQASIDEDAPDFAGYLLERAPFNGSSYQEIFRGKSSANNFTDTEIVPLDIYRYRLSAFDTAGKSSSYIHDLSATAGLGTSDVVAVLDMPAGPLFGPAEVTFDLSDSYMSSGGSLDSYELTLPGVVSLSGPSSTYTLNLQPGCYRVTGRAFSGLNFGTTVRFLRVLPRWQEDSFLLAEMSGNLERMLYARSDRLPDGRLVHAGYDESQQLLNFWVEDPTGLKLFSQYLSDLQITGSCEPVLIDGVLHFGFSSTNQVIIVSCDGSGLTTLLIGFPAVDDDFCLVRNPLGQLGIFYEFDNGGNFDLVYNEMGSSGGAATVVANVAGGVTGLDAVYNPTIGAYDICYGNNIALIWEQWSPSTGHIAGAGLYNFKVLGVDVELDPVSQRSAMLTTLDVAPFEAWYLAQTETGFWSLPEDVEDGIKATRYGNLLCTDEGPYIINEVNDGVDDRFRLYGRVGSLWTVLSEQVTTSSADSGISLLVGGSSALDVAFPLKGEGYFLRSFPLSGSPSETYSITGQQDGYLGELHATAGTDGLHAVWLNRSYEHLEHYNSPDGSAWTDKTPVLDKVTDLDLASTSEGEVYLSMIDVNSTELYYWDGAMFVQQQAYPGIAGYRPSLMSQPTNEKMFWYVHLQPANSMRFVEGNQANPFSFVSVNPAQPTWVGTVMDGGFSFIGTKPRWWCLSGPSLNQADLFFYDYNNVVPQMFNIDQSSNSHRSVWGRTLDSCLYDDASSVNQSVWMVNASGLGESLLFKPNEISSVYESSPFPIDDFFDHLLSGGARGRTVNMAQGHGRTALVMEAGLIGHDAKLLWSNFGNFHELRLPDQLLQNHGASFGSPEIVVGMDGRWHIIYLDLYTNQMRCISTVQ